MAGTIVGGRTAQARGADFESWLDTQHEKAEYLGLLAWSRHVSPKIRFVSRRNRAVQPVIVGKALADYVAQSCTGQTLVIEAKSRKGDTFRITEIESHQQKHLNACANNGGIALLLLEFRPDNVPGKVFEYPRRFAMPWLQVPWQIRRSAQSVSMEDLNEWEIKSECYLKRFMCAAICGPT